MFNSTRARVLFSVLFLTGSQLFLFARPKKDIVYLVNGDRLTCEIVNVDAGYLYVKLELGDGTVSLDWLKVSHIESPQFFHVTDQSGNSKFGTLGGAEITSPSEQIVNVKTQEGAAPMTPAQIVSVEQGGRKFIENLQGSISSGLQFTHSNGQIQYNFSGDVSFPRPKWEASMNFSSTFSDSNDGSDALRNDLQVGYEHRLRWQNYYIGTFAEFLQNQPQSLNLRSTLGAGVARYFKRTNHTRLRGLLGTTYTRENYVPGQTPQSKFNSSEMVVVGNVEILRFKYFHLDSTAAVYPSISDPGRVRIDTNTTLKFQIISNMHWAFNIYSNYDSRPPTNGLKADFGTSSSFGWSF